VTIDAEITTDLLPQDWAWRRRSSGNCHFVVGEV